MSEKICFITGANAGIGKAAAIQIARNGYRVIIGCRNEDRGRKALEEIKTASGSEAVELQIIDMSSKDSIKKASRAYSEKYKTLNVLIHNAADFNISRKEPVQSPDDIEQVWATNHIGPVYLTRLLLNKIKASNDGRIITIASKGLIMFPRLEVDLTDPEFKNRKYSVSKAYYQSKLAQIMYTYYLSKELKENDISVNCIRVINVKIDLSRYPDISNFQKFLYKLKSRSSITAESMAETYTYLATSPEMQSLTGKYFNEKVQEVNSSNYSRDTDNIASLMELTETYLKQRF